MRLSSQTPLLPALAVFAGSFLLFNMQPMLGRTLLPSFGGSAAVWTVCLAAYQTLLLGGYLYAHRVAGMPPSAQRALHAGLLVLAAAWAAGFAFLRPRLQAFIGSSGAPALEVLFWAVLIAGLPYVLLAAGSALVQAWVSGGRGREVYKLYAVSNAGSLLGLLAHPFVLERHLSLTAQWRGFAFCFLGYAALLAAVARRGGRGAGSGGAAAAGEGRERPPGAAGGGLPPALARPWLWFALPAAGSFLLNAVTAHLSTDVTPVPMMWALLLTVFLLSYIAGFSGPGEKALPVWMAASVLLAGVSACVREREAAHAFFLSCILGAGLLFFGCLFFHGWLYRIRPDAGRLTRYYLALAAGGAAGGLAASLVFPVVAAGILEYRMGMLAVVGLAGWFVRVWDHREFRGINLCLQAVCFGVALSLVYGMWRKVPDTVWAGRNFYGCLRVLRETSVSRFGDETVMYAFMHGQTRHGLQVKSEAGKRQPTTYYGPLGGGWGIQAHEKFTNGLPLRAGIVGLGVGTLACYGRSGDTYRFFEINPQVVEIATDTRFFSFLSDSEAMIEIVLGDARKQLEQEKTAGSEKYDVLVIDAYSGDSVPFHLATREAFQLYFERLAPGGILALHVSNWHIDLLPLCESAGRCFNQQTQGWVSLMTQFTMPAVWVFMSADGIRVPSAGISEIDWRSVRAIALPEDEKGSLLPLVRLNHALPVKKRDVRW
jgi:hypothetical protein